MWRALWFFFMFMAFAVAFERVEDIDALYRAIPASFDRSYYNVTLFPSDGGNPIKMLINDDSYIANMATDVIVIQVLCTWGMWVFAKFAAKTRIQRFAFAAPLLLVVPVTLAGLTGMCHDRLEDPCAYPGLPPFTFFNCPAIGGGDFIGSDMG